MGKVVVLDTGPLAALCRSKSDTVGNAARERLAERRAEGAIIVIPEVAAYELRRYLLHQKRSPKQASQTSAPAASIRRFHDYLARYMNLAITSAAMRRAAELWGKLAAEGRLIEDPKGLGADTILAGQVLTTFGRADDVELATGNVKDFERFEGINAIEWRWERASAQPGAPPKVVPTMRARPEWIAWLESLGDRLAEVDGIAKSEREATIEHALASLAERLGISAPPTRL
jgi:predicted nucleic acid-binding protein